MGGRRTCTASSSCCCVEAQRRSRYSRPLVSAVGDEAGRAASDGSAPALRGPARGRQRRRRLTVLRGCRRRLQSEGASRWRPMVQTPAGADRGCRPGMERWGGAAALDGEARGGGAGWGGGEGRWRGGEGRRRWMERQGPAALDGVEGRGGGAGWKGWEGRRQGGAGAGGGGGRGQRRGGDEEAPGRRRRRKGPARCTQVVAASDLQAMGNRLPIARDRGEQEKETHAFRKLCICSVV